jgi:cytochrome c553
MFMKTLSSYLMTAAATVCLALPLVSHAEMPAKAGSCIGCHGPNGNSTMPGIPSLAAQNSRYIYLQLRDFQEGRRHNDMMTPMTAGLSKDDMREIADYYSKQKLSSKGFKADAEKAKLGKAKADETLCAMCHLGEFVGRAGDEGNGRAGRGQRLGDRAAEALRSARDKGHLPAEIHLQPLGAHLRRLVSHGPSLLFSQ